MTTRRVKIGTAVIQAALHHPIRVAEQMALIDHLSAGRLIAGMGKGTMYNPYEYAAYGVDPEIASERFDEMEEVILKCWSGERVVHCGKYWTIDIPMLRPLPYTKPHPPLLRAISSDASTIAQARRGRPFLMAGPDDAVRKRVTLIRTTMREAGYDEARIATTLDQSWMWKNVVIGDTDAEAEEITACAFRDTLAYYDLLRLPSGFVEAFRKLGRVPPGYVFGTPNTVLVKLRESGEISVGGVIMRFRQGVMPHERAQQPAPVREARRAGVAHGETAAISGACRKLPRGKLTKVLTGQQGHSRGRTRWNYGQATITCG
jgi:alkanesulfonate monooxygenase SsuD/methylene tetrahydromethanopterin reductase-like flavin-dependent oxidoreductase (luciferase family)